MAAFVFAIIFVLGFLACMLIGRVGTGDSSFNLRTVAVIPLIIAVLLIIVSMWQSVGAREVGIPLSFGKVGAPVGSGIHLEPPWVSMIKCPLTEEYTVQNADPNSGDALYNQSVPISGSDQGSATADVTVGYHIDAKDVDTVYKLYACNLQKIKDNAVAQRVRSDVASAATAFTSTDLRSHRADIEQSALQLLQSELAPQGITVDSVTIADMKLSNTAQTAADNKLAAQQAVGVAQLHLQQANIDKQTAVVNAQATQAANAAQQQSLTPQILCQQTIKAIDDAHPTIINSWGICGGVTASGSNVITQLPAGH